MLIMKDGELPTIVTQNKVENARDFIDKFINACRAQNGWKYEAGTPSYQLAENYAKWCNAKRNMAELVFIFLIGHKMPTAKSGAK